MQNNTFGVYCTINTYSLCLTHYNTRLQLKHLKKFYGHNLLSLSTTGSNLVWVL